MVKAVIMKKAADMIKEQNQLALKAQEIMDLKNKFEKDQEDLKNLASSISPET
jgi:translation elongation factor EF-Tu-like GTPase